MYDCGDAVAGGRRGSVGCGKRWDRSLRDAGVIDDSFG